VVGFSDDKKPSPNELQDESQEGGIFSTEEIHIEEMAIDGICGVY